MLGLRLNDIQIRRSLLVGTGDFVLEIDARTQHGDMKFTGHFDDFGGFLTAVKEAAVFFTSRLGRIPPGSANANLLTKQLVDNPDRSVR
jgi:hypothetical protein